MIPALAREGLADAVDAFCEGIAFSPEQTARVFAAAKAAGLPVKLHADQLSNLHGAQLAARVRRAVGRPPRIHRRRRRRRDGARRHGRGAAAGRVLHPARDADCRRSRRSASIGVPMALATDSNPGTSPLTSLLTDHEHGGDAVPADGRGSARRRDARGRARARPARRGRHARSRASGAISPSGRSSARPSLSTASASIRCMRASGAADDRGHHADAGAHHAGRLACHCERRRRGSRSRRAGRRLRAARGRSKRSWRAASRSTASTPASASSRPCASRRDDLATLQRNIVLSHAAGVGEPLPAARRAADDGAQARKPRARRLGRGAATVEHARSDAGARH